MRFSAADSGLAQALALTLGLQFSRTQFTADLLPSDLTGVNVYVSPAYTEIAANYEADLAGRRQRLAG